MQDASQPSVSSANTSAPVRMCVVCGHANADWARYCTHCGQLLPAPQAALRAEIGHIAYLLAQLTGWQSRSLLSETAAAQLQREYADRQAALAAELTAPASRPEGAGAAPQAVVFHAAPAAAGGSGAGSAPPSAAPLSPGLGEFFQEHALKALFALATVLVLVAVRSMLAWDWMDLLAVRLIPVVPLGLAVLFWLFGQKTRRENPWAAFVYHGVAAALVALDLIAINKYWLFALPTRQVLLASSLAATAMAGALLLRWREVPYLHLFQVGALTTLYAALQALRWSAPPNDFRPQPLLLFGGAYLLYAALCLGAAWRARGAEQAKPAAEGNPWASAWLLWAHLVATTAVAFSALNAMLQGAGHQEELALVALLAGLIYAAGAQSLGEGRMVYVSGGFLTGSGVLWISAHTEYAWDGFGMLLLALSAAALGLAAFNGKRAAASSSAAELAAAYRQVALLSVVAATLVIWGRAVDLWTLGARGQHGQAFGENALLAALCGAFYALFAWWDRQPDDLYGALATWGLALVSGLAWAHAPTGAYPLALLLYGVALCLLAALAFASRPAAAKGKAPLPSPWAEWAVPPVVCGQIAGGIGALWEAYILSPSTPLAVPAWSFCALAAAAIYLGAARWMERAEFARLSWLPLVGGYALFLGWRGSPRLSALDAGLADALWVVGGTALAWCYGQTARWSGRAEFTYAGALTLIGSYLRAAELAWPLPAQWHALMLLPLLIALYAAGMRFALDSAEDALFGEPLRRTGLAVSVLALFWSAGHGDGLLAPSHAAMPGLITLTLAAYGAAYAALAVARRTPETVALGALTLTGAYLHHLLTRTPLLYPHPDLAPLSWPRFAFLAAQSGVFWFLVGWHVHRRWQRSDLAGPLLNLSGWLGLFSAVVGVLAARTPGEGSWSILTLAWAGAICFGLWLLENHEGWLHAGIWNLLAAWGLILYDHFGPDVQTLDLYLLPVGLYLILIGHREGHRQTSEQAQSFWWTGLLVILTPAFLAYRYGDVPWHTVLLLVECLAAVLWGIGQRIRAFVYAGLAFTAAFAASTIEGHLPEEIGTLAALLIGVGLFVVGFYLLTHREVMRKWAAILTAQWQAWQAWR